MADHELINEDGSLRDRDEDGSVRDRDEVVGSESNGVARTETARTETNGERVARGRSTSKDHLNRFIPLKLVPAAGASSRSGRPV